MSFSFNPVEKVPSLRIFIRNESWILLIFLYLFMLSYVFLICWYVNYTNWFLNVKPLLCLWDNLPLVMMAFSYIFGFNLLKLLFCNFTSMLSEILVYSILTLFVLYWYRIMLASLSELVYSFLIFYNILCVIGIISFSDVSYISPVNTPGPEVFCRENF